MFEGYKLTGVATATLCYYLSPAIVILLSPIFLHEKMSVRKTVCALIALCGMIPVSNVLNPESSPDPRGIALSLTAALLYAVVVILTKRIKGLSGLETTATQLGIASVIMALYVFIAVPVPELILDKKTIGIIVLLGIVHTGLAYLLYFSSVKKIPASTAAVLSYIDPVGALILSYTVLREDFTLSGFIGIVLIIVSMIIAELPQRKRES